MNPAIGTVSSPGPQHVLPGVTSPVVSPPVQAVVAGGDARHAPPGPCGPDGVALPDPPAPEALPDGLPDSLPPPLELAPLPDDIERGAPQPANTRPSAKHHFEPPLKTSEYTKRLAPLPKPASRAA